MNRILAFLFLMIGASSAQAGVSCSLPFNLQNGTTADATQVMANYNALVTCLGNAATAGANNDITSLSALTTPITPVQGGTTVFIGNATSTGSGNAQIVTATTPSAFGLITNYHVVFVAGFTNSGPMTLNVASSGATNVFRATRTGAAAMVGGEVIAGQVVEVVYDGTQYQLVSNNADSALYDASGNLTIPNNLTVTGTTTQTGILTQQSTSHEGIPSGTTAQRPGSPATANFRYNSDLGSTEVYNGTAWVVAVTAQPPPGIYRNLLIQNNSGTPNTQIDITATVATVSTSTGVAYTLGTVSVTCNYSTTGANGLDTGALASSTWYFHYVIYNPATATTACLGSLSSSSPTLPSGYTAFARYGAGITDGSTHFYRVIQRGRDAQYVVGTNPTVVPNIANGTAGTYSQTSPTLATASITGVVPLTASKISVVATNTWKSGSPTNVLVAPNTAWGGANNGDKGSAGQIFPIMIASAINNIIIQASIVLEGTPISTIAWVSGGAGGAISCMGWEDNL